MSPLHRRLYLPSSLARLPLCQIFLLNFLFFQPMRRLHLTCRLWRRLMRRKRHRPLKGGMVRQNGRRGFPTYEANFHGFQRMPRRPFWMRIGSSLMKNVQFFLICGAKLRPVVNLGLRASNYLMAKCIALRNFVSPLV